MKPPKMAAFSHAIFAFDAQVYILILISIDMASGEQVVVPLGCPVAYCDCPRDFLGGLDFVYFYCTVNATKVRFMFNPRESMLHPLEKGALNPLLLQSFSGLQSLNLSGLELTKLADNVFDSLNNLQMVYLNNNNLTHLPKDLWRDKTEIWTIKVDNNQLDTLQLDSLPQPTSLKRIVCNGNRIQLSDDIFSNFTKLEWLHLGRNQIKQLPPRLLYNLKVLEEFDARSNNISEIPDNFFINSLYLKEVYLGNNFLTTLPRTFSTGLLSLRELYLENNQLERIDNDVFQQLGRLVSLFLSNNKIEFVELHALQPLKNLEKLDLSENQLDFKDSVPLVRQSLKFLGLSHNKMTTLSSETWQSYPCLGDFDLSYNYLEFLQISWLNFMYSCNKKGLKYYNRFKNINRTETHNEVNLGNNKITAIDIKHTLSHPNQTGQLISPTTILIGNNPINCNCESAPLVTFLQGQSSSRAPFKLIDDELLCYQPTNLKNKKVSTVLESLPSCIDQQCPSQCECFTESLSTGLTVQCTEANLTEIPPSPKYNISVLNLDHNPLRNTSAIRDWRTLLSLSLVNALRAMGTKHLTSGILPIDNLTILTKLIMSHNALESLADNLFCGVTELVHLDLSYNTLQTLSASTFSSLPNLHTLHLNRNNLTTLPDDLFEHNPRIEVLRLCYNNLTGVGNTLNTTCQLRELYLDHNYLVHFPSNSTCLLNVQIVSLAHNNISSVISVGYHNPKLKRLDLSFNNLTVFNASEFDLLESGTIVNLENNLIKRFYPPDAARLHNTSTPVLIRLNLNPASCNCLMHNFIEYLKNRYSSTGSPKMDVVVDDLTCKRPRSVKGRKVQTLSTDEIRCRVRDCPSSCRCFTSYSEEYRMLQCTEMPVSVGQDTRHLTLTSGTFKSLDKLQLPQLANLTDLKLSQLTGTADDLQPTVFQNLTLLKVLSLVQSPLMHADQEWFQRLRSLKELDLNSDQISAISSNMFDGTNLIERLNLSYNSISQLPDKLLHNMVCLEFLDLSFNQIHVITAEFMRTGNHLQELYLKENSITSIEYNALTLCDDLIVLDLSKNNLGISDTENLPNKIQKLNLSGNTHIDKFSEQWFTLGNLQHIDLSFTQIKTIQMDDMIRFPIKSTIYLRNTSISQVIWFSNSTLNQMDSSTSRTKIVLDNNAVQCDCHVEPLANYLSQNNVNSSLTVEIQAENLVCNIPYTLYGNLVSSLKPRDLYCTLETCPESSCNCYFATAGNKNVINCSGTEVGNLNLDYVSSIQELLLDQSAFNSQELYSAKWNNLTVLSLRNVNSTESLRTLLADILQNKSRLKYLDVSSNDLHLLPQHAFRDNHNLQNLVAASNQIKRILASTFDNLLQLEYLDLSVNRLDILSQSTFLKLTNLKELNLAQNQISFFTHDFLPPDGHLRVLNLSHNSFHSMPSNISFRHLTELQTLDWSYNSLQIPAYFPPLLPLSVVHLNLSWNQLTHVPFQNWMHFNKLKSLDVSGNLIKALNMADLVFANNSNIAINLDQNYRLHKYNLSLLDRHVNNAEYWVQHLALTIDKTSIACDCQFQSYAKETELHYSNATIFLKVKPSQPCINKNNETYCSITQSCYPNCFCFKQILSNMTVMNCTGLNLTALPTTSPDDINKLILDNNQITQLYGLDNNKWNSVTHLSLRHNRLQELGRTIKLPKIRYVYLDNNRLDWPSGWLLDMIGNSSLAFNLTLGKNPWQCMCDQTIIKFKQWLIDNTQRIGDIKDIMCVGSDEHVHSAQLCPLKWPHIVASLVVGLLVGTSCLVTVTVFYFRHKADVNVWLYAHGCCASEDTIDEDKEYDAFISYSSEDTEFVFDTLVPRLENSAPFYKLCIHERDWHVGEQILDQIALSVEQSRRTIVVLSKNFVQSMWSGLEFQAAHHQSLKDHINRIIIVVLGEVPPKETLDPDLRMHINMNTYLKCDDAHFFDKLKYAMPHKRAKQEKQSFENNGLQLAEIEQEPHI